jgi:phosphatidylserine/phosphatidylglycerophosphate/cardiolipin synthase-like enzyme
MVTPMRSTILCALALLISSTASAATAEVTFSPAGHATELVVQTINSAQTSIRVAAYGFTSKPIIGALILAHQRGVDVEIVLDKSNAEARYPEGRSMAAQGVPVRLDYHYAIMHDKFIVVDGNTVETGSFNFTFSAEKSNAENVIVLHNAPDIAALYTAEWQRLWDESLPVQ